MRIRFPFRAAIFALIVTALAFEIATGADAQATGARRQSSASNAAAASANAPVRVRGDVMMKYLIHMVPPVYPAIAKVAHVEGTVMLHATIRQDGSVEKLTYVSGPVLLEGAALDAVRQWRFKPYLLNGEPVEAETSITVMFKLGGSSPSSQAVRLPGENSEAAPSQNAASSPQKSVTTVVVPVTIDPQLHADILTLLDVMNIKAAVQSVARSEFAALRPALISALPDTPHRAQIADAYAAKLTALLESQDFVNGVVALYAKYFNDDDIKGMTQFFRTPAGQHYVAASPELGTASAQICRQIVIEHLAEIFQELCAQYPELQGKAKFCPATERNESGERLGPKMRRRSTAEPRFERGGEVRQKL